jgi:hypothetical protein
MTEEDDQLEEDSA